MYIQICAILIREYFHFLPRMHFRHPTQTKVLVGDELLEGLGYRMIHAVGRAAASGREPRLVDLAWNGPASNPSGSADSNSDNSGGANSNSNGLLPRLTLIGKGVTFDTGGLNLKPGDSMLTMKKDMGGAATVLGLACLVVDAKLPVRELEWPRACYLTLSVGCYSS